MEDEILDLYFEKKLKQIEIAKILNISKSTVSKIVSKDNRYIAEKQQRKDINKAKHNKQIQACVEKKRKLVQFNHKVDDLVLKIAHIQAVSELSKRPHLFSNENYRKWNVSAYHYNLSKNRYEFDENLGRSYDVPKYIKVKKY